VNIRRNPSYIALSAFLKECGLDFDLDRCSKHPALLVKVDPPLKFTFPGSSGDRRAALNCVRDLKRLLSARGFHHA